MQHYDDSVLRRSIDEPEHTDANITAHLAGCATCHARYDDILANARIGERAFSGPIPAVDSAQAYAHMQQFSTNAKRGAVAWSPGLAGLAAAAVLVCALIFTPLGGFAAQMLTIFEPHQFVPLAITATDSEQMRLMPSLKAFGTLQQSPRHSLKNREQPVSLAHAAAVTGLAPRSFSVAPRGIPARTQTYLTESSTVAFTFSAAKARAYELRNHRNLPPMPAGLDGSTIRVTFPSAIVRAYGNIPKSAKDLRAHGLDNMVLLVESKAPSVTSTGASLTTLANYLFAMPNLPADVAAQLHAITDPSRTLPIPLQIDKQTASPVRVDGVEGLALGDQTGLGAGVLWQRGSVIYAVVGSLKKSEAIALADSLR